MLTFSAMGAGLMAGLRPVSAQTATPSTDGTPMQFIPKTPKDANPLEGELSKYAKCPYCGMDRKEYHFSRHLIHYSDDLVDGTCSLRCAAVSLSLNLDRTPKAIYAADFGAPDEIKPLVLADKAVYLLGGGLRAVMTKTAKTAFASRAKAEEIKAKSGGEIVDFNQALTQSFLNMAEDTMMIRGRREERRRKQAESKG
jgi:nitrous oxide reductase accessory protein NosL